MPIADDVKVVSLEIVNAPAGAAVAVSSAVAREFGEVKTVVTNIGTPYDLTEKSRDLPRPGHGTERPGTDLYVSPADRIRRLVPVGFKDAGNALARFVGIGYGVDGNPHVYTTHPVRNLVLKSNEEIYGIKCAGDRNEDGLYKKAEGIADPGLT